MVAVLFYEHNRVQEIENETLAVEQVQYNVNIVHRHITILATHGETAIAWDDEDYANYRSRRLRIDFLLQIMQDGAKEFFKQDQIDTLRYLLASKEEHLHRIMLLFHRQDEADSLLVNHLPKVAREATQTRTVVQKKTGIAKLFGGKKTVELPPSPDKLHALNRQLLALQMERIGNMDNYIDSLRTRNRELNRKLFALLGSINDHMQAAFQYREQNIAQLHRRSTHIITRLIFSAIILLVISFMIIQRHLRRDTKLRQQMEEIINKNRDLLDMRKKIILTISHDIRAPLSIINGSAELAMDTRDRKKRNGHLSNIGMLCKHILHLLNNLLDVYRLNEAKETRNDIPFRLSDMLGRLAAGFSHTVNDKGLLFHCDFRNTEVTVCGDADRIAQVADNLLSNAVKFTEAGHIRFSARYGDGTLLLEIEDTGIGMSEETAARIFNPFERSATGTNADGFGLGLSITKGLVALLDGKIDVTSEVGKGSTFRVSFPLPLTNEAVENAPQPRGMTLRLPQRVAAIDDDPLQLEIVKEMLERNGVSCMTCHNVRELVGDMRKTDYDLLLSDIQMAGTNGFDLLELLRNSNIGNSRTIPVVAMTARGDKEREAFASAGFAACIYKPFSMSELLGIISSVTADKEPAPARADFASLTAEVRDKKKLLRTFIGQSRKDIGQLREAGNDRERLREVVHRMLPMWELLQTDELLHSYRDVLHDDKTDDGAVGEYTQRVIDHAALLIAEAEKEMKHETEDIDSRR